MFYLNLFINFIENRNCKNNKFFSDFLKLMFPIYEIIKELFRKSESDSKKRFKLLIEYYANISEKNKFKSKELKDGIYTLIIICCLIKMFLI